MALLGALSRSRTFTKSASEKDKSNFRNALRTKVDKISKSYKVKISEQDHIINIVRLSDELTDQFPHCLGDRKISKRYCTKSTEFLGSVNLTV